MAHIDGEVIAFRKELNKLGFVIEMKTSKSGSGHWKIYKEGQPFYSFHVAKKGIRPCKDWIFKNYKIDMRNKPKKNLTKREQRANMGNKLQLAEQQVKMLDNRFIELVSWLKDNHVEAYEEYMERYK